MEEAVGWREGGEGGERGEGVGMEEERNWAVLPMRLGCKGGMVRVRYCRESGTVRDA